MLTQAPFGLLKIRSSSNSLLSFIHIPTIRNPTTNLLRLKSTGIKYNQHVKAKTKMARSYSLKPSYYKTATQVRGQFLSHFEKNGHLIYPSSNIVPANDPTLLFTSAGMVQFKDSFLGLRRPPHPALTTSQKCVRAGGKHNDLDNVGFTARHHTFFEMLGNFSFGAYDKREAIRLAWSFLTTELGLPKERLSVSVLQGDTDTANAWKSVVGLTNSSIRECGLDDNFWSMGDIGPCGPCTEIFWDQIEPVDGDRYLEIWNLVFMQYLKLPTSEQSNKQSIGVGLPAGLSPLPVPCIDTGMGLERLSSVLQGVRENYQIDSLSHILYHTQQIVEAKAGSKLDTSKKTTSSALRVIVDHLRSASFLLAEGLMPGNAGRAYVLRRIIRRATRYSHNLGVREPILADIFPFFLDTMKDQYPELVERQQHITNILAHEEASFFMTINRGLEEINRIMSEEKELQESKTIPGTKVFFLYETFGFPVDLTELIAKENGWKADVGDFENLLISQKKKDRLTWRGSGDEQIPSVLATWNAIPRFTGYEKLVESGAEIVEMHQTAPETVWVSIDPCPFYAENGGQIGDRGIIVASGHTFDVVDAVHPYQGGIALKITLSHTAGELPLTEDQVKYILQPGRCVEATVDSQWRRNIQRNHTATHLLHAALKQVLGPHVVQAGSRVAPDMLRFEFSHYGPLTHEEIAAVENWVNEAISKEVVMESHLMSYEEAMARKAVAIFSEKYDKTSKLRVINAPGLSMELCGGTHVKHTSDLAIFKIVGQHSGGTGTRRLFAMTGQHAFEWLAHRSHQLDQISAAIHNTGDTKEIVERIKKLYKDHGRMYREIQSLKEQLRNASQSLPSCDYWRHDGTFRDFTVCVHQYKNESGIQDADFLERQAVNFAKEFPDKIHICLNEEIIKIANSDKANRPLLKEIASQIGLRGGGHITYSASYKSMGRCTFFEKLAATLQSDIPNEIGHDVI